MDNIKDVRTFVKKIYEYLNLHNKGYCDVDILQSKVFRQIFIAHNIHDEFEIYNTWDFKKDMHNMLVRDYYNKKICEQEEYIAELNEIF